MARISLWMLCLSFLLPSACVGSRCLSLEQFNNRAENLKKNYKVNEGVPAAPPPQRTCAQATKEMRGELRNRALSPWTYRLDTDPNRIPSVIAIADCLCSGCVVDGHEDNNYNSVTVKASRLVYRKRRCGEGYKLEKNFITISVGCTCVKPKTASDTTDNRK